MEITKNDIKDIYYLTPMQEGMLFHYLMDRESPAYFEQYILTIKGEIDKERFKRSLELITARHDVLRTVFIFEGVKKPLQVVLKESKIKLNLEDITHVKDKEAKIIEIRERDKKEGFDLSKDSLMRVRIIKADEGEYRIIWSFHHIIMDGWCIGIIVKEIFAIYETLGKMKGAVNQRIIEEELGESYAFGSYIKWLESRDKEGAKRYWGKYLEGYEQRAGLPQARKKGATDKYIPDKIELTIAEPLTNKLNEIGRENQATLNTLLQAIWGIILQRYNNTDDVVFGYVVSGRPPEIKGIEKMIGLFINTVPIRIRGGKGQVFNELVRQTQADLLNAGKHEHLSLAEIQAVAGLKQGLVDHIIIFENFPVETIKNEGDKLDFTIEAIEVFEQTNYDFNIVVIPGKELKIELRYDRSVYSREMAETIAGHIREAIKSVIEKPDVALSEIEILTGEEKRRIILELNNTAAEYPREKTIHRLFAEQVQRTPENIALVYEGKQLTYRDLNKKANHLAVKLREKGIKSDSIVGLMVERSLEMVIGIIGILKAGGAYLPIDPDYPEDRIKYMLDDSGASILLTQRQLADQLDFQPEIIYLEDEKFPEVEDIALEPVGAPQDLAYIIYTSGTTGRPKGAMIEHRNVVRLLFNDRLQFDFSQNDVWTMFHSVCFDFSVWEMYGALLYGGKLIVISKTTARDTKEFLQILKNDQVTILNQTPTAFYNLAEEELNKEGNDLKLRYVIFGGEALQPTLLRNWKRKYPAVKLINMYGITETTVHVTYKEITDAEIENNISNIGKPIPTLACYVMDRALRLMPVGVPGELCVGGAGVGRGYLNRPELTAERFVQNPYQPDGRLYRSGDLARVLSNGELEYLGRIDHQVKIRGHRIELGEIESALLKHEAVKETVVIDRKDKNNHKYLCAYVVVGKTHACSRQELRAHLLKELPDYMIPSYFVLLEKLPLTSNGKIDRKALPEPDGTINTGNVYEAPRNDIETKMADVWQEVLGIEKVGINDNFFELGGDSIKAISLISKMNKILTANIEMKELYAGQTIKELARNITQTDSSQVETELKEGLKTIEAIKQGILNDARLASLLPEDYEDFFPLSKIQQGMIFYTKLRPEEPLYHDQFIYLLKFEVFDINTFNRALQLVVHKHPMLRTIINAEQFPEPLQIVRREIVSDVKLEDLSSATREDQEQAINNYLKRDLNNKFLSFNDLLWRMRVFKLNMENYCIVLSFQHAILDGWSVSSLNTEIMECYHKLLKNASYQMTPLGSSYKDYVAINLGRKAAPETKEFWSRVLKDYTRTKLPFNIAGKKINDKHGSKKYINILNAELLQSLERKAKSCGYTVKTLCLSAYIYLLGIITTDKDIVTGVVTHDRPTISDSEKVLGCFLNTIPIRINLSQNLKKHDLSNTVKDYLNSVKAHELFLADIAEMIGEHGNTSGNPIFDTLFNFTDFHVLEKVGSLEVVEWSNYNDLKLESNEMTNTLFDLEVSKTLDTFVLQIKYTPNYFNDKDIQTAAGLYIRILEQFAREGDEELNAEALLTEAEKQRIIYEFNHTQREYPKEKTMHLLFEEQVKRTPDNIALVFEDRSMTYRELNAKANQLARLLIEKGVQSGDHVGLVAQRSFEMIIGMYAILKCGGAYVPIDPEYPPARKDYLAENSKVSAVIIDQEYEDINYNNVIKINNKDMERFPETDLELRKDSKDLAYIIYTSGSTGLPKGVMIEHHSAVNLIKWVNTEFNINERDTLLFITSMCFDLSVYDIFGILATGGKVVIVKKEQVQNPEELKKIITNERITFWDSVPSTMNYLVNSLEESDPDFKQEHLRLVFMSGDWIPVKLPERVRRYFPNTRVISLGGATEGTVWSIYYPIERVTEYQTSIPYGRPIANNYFYILDENLKVLPEGVAGELYIGGVGVARGYMNDPERTKASFIKNRFLEAPGEMMYKTGDLGRMLPDGNIEFLGRKDYQVKIRGFRVELGEIEHRLLKYPSLKEAVVVDKTDKDGNKYLCAYVVVGNSHACSPQELRAHLMKELPDYMIPAYFVQLEKLPLTPNGKIDRKALPDLGHVQTGVEYVAPRNDLEERLVRIWEDILGLEHIGVFDDFFELGGHSLKATILASRIHKEFNVELALREIFEAPTVQDMAESISRASQSMYAAINALPEQEYYPVSSAQKRMYILNRIDAEQTQYNNSGAVTVKGDLDRKKLEEVLRKLVERHESLRTSFKMLDGKPVQQIHKEVELRIEYNVAPESEIGRIIHDFIRPFNFKEPPLLRIGLIQLEPARHILLFDMHHIISDGTSMGILIQEFINIYNGEVLPELRIQYKDFSEWQNRLFQSEALKKQEEYWLAQFEGEIPVLNLPTDYPRPAFQSFEGSNIWFKLSREITEKLNQFARECGATLYMALLAVYNILLYKYSGQEDIIIGSPIAGRPHADLQNIIGMFVNTLVMRNRPEGHLTCREFMAKVKDNALKAYENQDYQFEELVERIQVKRDLSRNPLFDVMFVLQNAEFRGGEIEGLQFSPYPLETRTAKFDLSLQAIETVTGIEFSLEYSTKLFKRETVERMAAHFQNIIEQVVSHPGIKLAAIEMLSKSEKEQILYEFNDTTADYPRDKTIHELFEEQVEKNPDQTAVMFGDNCLTYMELNEKANQLARALRNKRVKADSIVGIMAERSLEMIIGIMAIIKAGGAYLPIDPGHPEERIRYMLENSSAEILLTQHRFLEKIAAASMVNIETIDLDDAGYYLDNGANLEHINSSKDLAYVIYTSGSTGRPKGVMIEHYSVINRLRWMQKQYPLNEKDVILQKTPFTFDVSVWELFWWALAGAKVIFLEPGGEKDPASIINAIQKYHITTIHFVPSMLNTFISYLENSGEKEEYVSSLKSLRQVFASGEALNLQLVERFNRLLYKENQTKLHNLYGPTEATVDVSYFDCSTLESMEVIPIGKPIDNIRLHIINKDNQLQPIGIPGELCISGDGLARGYINNPELTAEKFVPNPFYSEQYPVISNQCMENSDQCSVINEQITLGINSEPKQFQTSTIKRPFILHTSKMYKTGDLARWLPDGNIEFLGRLDHQVKIRGFRIELGEIENRLLSHEFIKEAVVIERADTQGDKYLCAYLVTGKALTVTELREFLLGALPEYMVPSYFVPLEKLPLTPNGKVDRKALPEPTENLIIKNRYIAPRNEIEETLVQIWRKILKQDVIGINHNFFDLGGNSLLLVKLHEELENVFPSKIHINDLFNFGTIQKIADFLIKEEQNTFKDIPLKTIAFPGEYFQDGSPENKEFVFEFSINGDLLHKLKRFAVEEEVQLYDILLSMYFYLFSQISKQSNIAIQTMLEGVNQVKQIEIDLSNFTEFSSLYKFINQRRKEDVDECCYKIPEISGARLNIGENQIAPLIYRHDLLQGSFNLKRIYMLLFKITEEPSQLTIFCEYYRERLRWEQVQELLSKFETLINRIVEQYEASSNLEG